MNMDEAENNYKIEANMDEWIMPRYKWRVQLEIEPLIVVIEANTAEEAMIKAEQKYQLANIALDDIPTLTSVAANIQGITDEFAAIMDEIKQ
jgi:hypothetical protein